jgi:Phospholipase_D-nuclease N-terminal
VLAAEFGTGQVFVSMLYFFLFFILIWLVLSVFTDIFRSPDLSGWAKALWVLFVIVLPFLGVFTYMIVRGPRMSEQAVPGSHRREELSRMYVGDLTPRP